MKIEERALSKRLRELTEAQAALAKEDDATNKRQKEASPDPEPMPAEAARAEEEVVESITVLVDQQDVFFKVLKVDMEEIEPVTPTLFQFMERLFKFELGEGARTGLKSIDFVYVDELAYKGSADMEVDHADQEVQEGEDAAARSKEPALMRHVDQPTQIHKSMRHGEGGEAS